MERANKRMRTSTGVEVTKCTKQKGMSALVQILLTMAWMIWIAFWLMTDGVIAATLLGVIVPILGVGAYETKKNPPYVDDEDEYCYEEC